MNLFTAQFDRSMWGNCLAAACVSLAVLGAATTARGQCDPREVAHLFASDGAPITYFGVSLAISGDTIVVGNPDDDTPRGIDAGSAYIFVRDGGGIWTEQAHLFASDGAAQDLFGISVAISGDTLVVGAWGDDTLGGANAGSAYVFVRDGLGGWTQQARLFASDGAAGAQFGNSVAIFGDTVVVTAFADDTPLGGVDAGSAYVFVRSGTVWTQQAHLFASDGAAGDQFGGWSAISVSGDTIVVGAWTDDTPGGTNAGSAYVFVRSGTVWTQQAHLFASDGAAGDNFGYAVEISGDTIVVGALLDDTLLGGVNAGSAYVFVRDGLGGWTQQARLFASDGAAGDQFAIDIAISGDTAVMGAWTDDTPGGTNAGSAYVFVRNGADWSETDRLFASDGAADDRFGYVVEMSGDTVVVGAFQDDTPRGTDAGSAYVFGLHTCGADFDCDGFVTGLDFDAFVAAFESGDPTSDFDGDGFITGLDFDAYVLAFEAGC